MTPTTDHEQIKERFSRYHALFSTVDGKWVLDDLEEQYLYLSYESTRYAGENNPIGLAQVAGQQALITKIRNHALGVLPTFEDAEERDVLDE